MACSELHLADYTFEDTTTFQETPVCRAIQQGRYYQVKFTYPGDVSAGTIVAEIRDVTIENSGVVLATFSMLTPSYDAINDETLFVIYLSDSDTQALPETPDLDPTRDIASASNYYVWDAYLLFNGEKRKVFELSFVQVKGRSSS